MTDADRLVKLATELAELNANTHRLRTFIDYSSTFEHLPAEEQDDMRIQLGGMEVYARALGRRVVRLAKEVTECPT